MGLWKTLYSTALLVNYAVLNIHSVVHEPLNHQRHSIIHLLSSCLLHFRTSNVTIVDAYVSNRLSLLSNAEEHLMASLRPKPPRWLSSTARFGEWQECQISIFGFSDLTKDTAKPVIFRDPLFLQENPDIALLILDIHADKLTIFTIAQRLRSVVVQSYFLLMDLETQSLSFLNLLANTDEETFTSFTSPQSSNPSEFLNFLASARKESKDFAGFEIQTPAIQSMYYLIMFIPPECTRLGKDFGGSETYCSIAVLSNTLNFSLIGSDEELPKIGTLSLPADLNLNLHETWTEGPEILERLLSSRRRLPFGFVIVINKSEVHMTNLLSAFDTVTWLGIISSILCVSFSLVFVKNTRCHNVTSFLANFCKSFLLVLAVLVEQSPGQYFHVSKIKYVIFTRIILFIWLYVCVVLSGGYRGVFFSILTSTSTPSVPKNFEELSVSGYLPVAIDSIPISTTVFLPYFSHITTDYLNSIAGESTPSVLKRKSMYQRLLNKTVHLNRVTHGKIKVAYDTKKPFPPMLYHNLPHDFIIPRNFAAVSSSEGVEHFSNLMRQSGDYFLINSEEWDTFIATENELVCTRNFILAPITRIYMSLHESGLYDMWRKYSSALKVSTDSIMMKCIENLLKANWTDPSYFNFGVCASALYTSGRIRQYRPTISSHLKDVSALSIQLILVVFILWGIGAATASLTYILEFLTSNKTNIRSTRNQPHYGSHNKDDPARLLVKHKSLGHADVIRINYALQANANNFSPIRYPINW